MREVKKALAVGLMLAKLLVAADAAGMLRRSVAAAVAIFAANEMRVFIERMGEQIQTGIVQFP